MNFAKRIIALLLSLIILCSAAIPVLAAKPDEIDTRAEYTQMLNEEGYPAMTTDEFLAKLNAAGDFFRVITGNRFPPEEKINISFDKMLTEANLYVLKNSGVDMEKILRNLPPINNISSLIVEAFEIDTVAFREEMFAACDKHDAEGTGLGVVYYAIGCFMSIIDKVEVYTETTSDPAVYEISLNMIFRDGGEESFRTGLFINTETGDLSGANETGMFGLGFNFNFNEMVVYTVIDAWTRNMGFAVTYDVVANAVGIYDYVTKRYHFDYDGLEWMIQVWKGTYFYVTNGAEIGIYNRVPGEELGTFYNCANDEQMMEMSIKLLYKDTLLMNRGPQKHWWLTGFHLSGIVYEPASLTMIYTINFPNSTMLKAFTDAVDRDNDSAVTYNTDGTVVTVHW